MSSAHRLTDIKAIPKDTPERREAIRAYLRNHPGILKRAAKRAKVHPTMVSKVLHGVATSEPVEKAIEREEVRESGHARVA